MYVLKEHIFTHEVMSVALVEKMGREILPGVIAQGNI